jgi:phage terminase large subunit-like protein
LERWKLLPASSQAALAARARWIDRARPAQITPEGLDWSTWLILAGRGWGKTRTGAEDVAWYGASRPGVRIAVIGPTYADARDTCIEGESGILGVLPREAVDTWNRSLGELILANGSRYKLFSADEPDRLRGPQHHRAWCDELAAWTKPDTWDQMLFGLRLGEHPQVVVTTTPKPTPLVRRLALDARTRLTKGRTLDNAANLAPSALEQLQARYAGTRLGRQELEAEILDDVPGALWTRAMIDEALKPVALPAMKQIVVSIDPSGTKGDADNGDSIGIVVAGKGVDGRAYVLADRTCKLSPNGWGRRAVEAYHEFKANMIIAERNFGGAMVEHVVRTADPYVPYEEVVASRGKAIRAEPVAALYEQGRVSHVAGMTDLEDQMCQMAGDGYLGEGSPDRLDAMVWALSHLMLGEVSRPLVVTRDQAAAFSAPRRRFS